MNREEMVRNLTAKQLAELSINGGNRDTTLENLGCRKIGMADNPRGGDDYLVEDEAARNTGYHPVAFPQAAAQAASWDPGIPREIGMRMGRECRNHGISILLRPGINLKRSPLCGRNFEYYSEDPVLSGKLGASFIRGVQAEGVAACVKHYAVNSQEYERMTTNAVVSARALRELYLKSFEIAIREGKPWSLMTSYNRVNGHWVPANREMMDVLRKDFGFDGLVISDAMAVHTEKVESHRCGMDLEGSSEYHHVSEYLSALESGEVPPETARESVRRMLRLLDRTKEVRSEEPPDQRELCEEDHIAAERLAAECMVLLKNDGILPLDPKNVKKAAVIGRLAVEPYIMGCGSGHMNGYRTDRPLEALKQVFPETDFLYAEAYGLAARDTKEAKPVHEKIEEALRAAEQADLVFFFSGLPTGYESEGYDRTTLSLPEDMGKALLAVLSAGKPVILVNSSGSPVDLGPFAEKLSAILHSYPAGEAFGSAAADILSGKVNPGGRLPETFPVRIEDTPAYLNFPRYPQEMNDVLYAEDLYIGYRWYDARKIPVLFPFGFGLSYTEFELSEIRPEETELGPDGEIRVHVRVTNTGNRTGAETVQLYAGKPDAGLPGPEKELKAFGKCRLDPGESAELILAFPVSELRRWHEKRKEWVLQEGKYLLYIGSSCACIKKQLELSVRSADKVHRYKQMDCLEWFFSHPGTEAALEGLGSEAQMIFGPEKHPLSALFAGMPAYRLTEGGLSEQLFLPEKDLTVLMDRLNQNPSL